MKVQVRVIICALDGEVLEQCLVTGELSTAERLAQKICDGIELSSIPRTQQMPSVDDLETYTIPSGRPGQPPHKVSWLEGDRRWICSCPGFTHHGRCWASQIIINLHDGFKIDLKAKGIRPEPEDLPQLEDLL